MKPDELADKLVPDVREAGPLALLKAAVNERIVAAILAERLAERERCEKRINEDVDWHPGEELLRAAVINAIRNDK